MPKSRNFSVYLLKPEFNANNSLKEGHQLQLLREDDTNIPEGGVMYYGQNPIRSPWWKEYWGINQELRLTSVGAIVFLPVGERWFAITFGTSYHNLKENSYEYDFGLRTTLNTLDPDKIKSTDLLMPETAKRQRIQIPNASNLTHFNISTDDSIVKRLTGAVKNEYQDTLRNATGACSLRFTTDCEPNELVELCSRLYTIYTRRDYEESFPDLQNITPIKDPDLINSLEDLLLNDFHENSINLTLGIPDIVDYSTNFKVKYRGASRPSNEYEDVYIGNYREYLNERNVEIENISIFNKHFLCILDENGSPIQSYSIYKAFLFDCTYNNKTYHLCEGEWYEINTNFIDRLKSELDPIFIDEHAILCECNQKREDEYNIHAQRNSPIDEVYCLDKKSIAPQGQRNIEPCDLIALKNNMVVELIHNKISTRSAYLSHLFNQGVNSVIILQQSPEAKEKLKDLIEHNRNFEEKINNDQYHVTYGIISNKNKELKSDALPIFSRISLFRCVKTLKLMKIPINVYLIKDNVDRKHLMED